MTLTEELQQLTQGWLDDPEAAWYADQVRAVLNRHDSPLDATLTRTLTHLAGGATMERIETLEGLTVSGVNWRISRIHTLYKVTTTTQAVVTAFREGHLDPETVEGKWEGTAPSERHTRTLQAVADYGTNQAAAEALGLKRPTVATHLHHMSADAGTGLKVQLVVRAFKAGWIK